MSGKQRVSIDWWKKYHKEHTKDFMGNYWQDMPHTAREAFSFLWNSTINKSDLSRYAWKANPWVWVIEYDSFVNDETSNDAKTFAARTGIKMVKRKGK